MQATDTSLRANEDAPHAYKEASEFSAVSAFSRGAENNNCLRFIYTPTAPAAYRLVVDLRGRLSLEEGAREYLIAVPDSNSCSSLRGAIEDLAKDKAAMAPPAFADHIETLLRHRALDLLGLARKAGCVQSGFGKVHAALTAGTAVLLFNAQDSAEGGAKKLAHKARATDIALCDIFSVAELSGALGRDNVHHIVLSDKHFLASMNAILRFITHFDDSEFHKEDSHD